jgi:1,4-alpha-glucan branching enzyme
MKRPSSISRQDSTATKADHAAAFSLTAQLIPVHFEYTHPTAITVAVAGSFNEWHPTSKSMQPSGLGRWRKEAFLRPGEYEYCLVVDGLWMPDPQAPHCVANPFGGRNSVLKVVAPPAITRAAPEPNMLLKNSDNQQPNDYEQRSPSNQ